MIRRVVYSPIRNKLIFVVLFGITINLAMLIISPPKFLEHPCPSVLVDKTPGYKKFESSIKTSRSITCDKLFDNTTSRRTGSTVMDDYKWCSRRDALSSDDYLKLTDNCDKFRDVRGYGSKHITTEEQNFPIAFSILMHEQVEQMERLLRAIYRPQNVYCIHVDLKSPVKLQAAVGAIAKCLPNVFLSSKSVQVHWAEYSVLEAELICLNDLWNYKWNYYINLSGRDYPLRTNNELVQILKAYNGGNEVDGSPNKRPRDWTEYSWRKEYWRTNTIKEPPPHGFTIAKGSTHVAVSRKFVDYALHDPKALDLLEWMKDVRCPDEHFFPTLNSNPQLNIPGAYTGNPDLRDGFLVRYKLWLDKNEVCHGKWQRYICMMASGDLPRLVGAKHMFVNKLSLELDPVAFQCMEERYFGRARQKKKNSDFNIKFYKSRKLVKQHV